MNLLQVINNDVSTTDSGRLIFELKFNKPVDQASVIAGTSIILGGAKKPNAPGTVTWTSPIKGPRRGSPVQNPPAMAPTQLWFEAKEPFSQIVGPGGTDTGGVTLTLKSTVKAHDGSPLESSTKHRGAPATGDWVMRYQMPG